VTERSPIVTCPGLFLDVAVMFLGFSRESKGQLPCQQTVMFTCFAHYSLFPQYLCLPTLLKSIPRDTILDATRPHSHRRASEVGGSPCILQRCTFDNRLRNPASLLPPGSFPESCDSGTWGSRS